MSSLFLSVFMKKINLNSFIYNSHITKNDIFNVVKQEDIYSFYLGFSIEAGDKINSPFREDNVPSFGFYYRRDKSGILMFNDLATPNSGDAVVFVSKLFQINYKEALFKICYDFGLSDVNITEEQKLIINKHISTASKEKVKIEVKVRKWCYWDKYFWQSFGITKKTLRKYNVYPISHILFNGNAVQCEKYAYVYVEYKDKEVTYKIYQPFSKNSKWISNINSSVHQGYSQLPEKHSIFIITKSLKDVMSIRDVCRVPSIGLQSESIMMKETVFQEYQSRFGKLFCLFDNDPAGMILAEKYKEKFNTINIFMPQSPGVTDFSDYVKKYNKHEAKKVLFKLIN